MILIFGGVFLISFVYHLAKEIKQALKPSEVLFLPSETAFPGNEYNLTLDKLNAINAQIEAYNAVIRALDGEAKDAQNPVQLAHIRKKQADMVYKISTLSEKADKLDRQLFGDTV